MMATISQDVRARLDEHLDAVERALVASGVSREQRRGVVDDLEAQITEMLERRSSQPTTADVAAILATLDPPEAYGSPRGTRPNGRAAVRSKNRRFKMRHVVAIVLVVCGTVMLMTPSVTDFWGAHLSAHANYLNSVSPSGLTEDDIRFLHMMGTWTFIAGMAAAGISFILDLVRKG